MQYYLGRVSKSDQAELGSTKLGRQLFIFCNFDCIEWILSSEGLSILLLEFDQMALCFKDFFFLFNFLPLGEEIMGHLISMEQNLYIVWIFFVFWKNCGVSRKIAFWPIFGHQSLQDAMGLRVRGSDQLLDMSLNFWKEVKPLTSCRILYFLIFIFQCIIYFSDDFS